MTSRVGKGWRRRGFTLLELVLALTLVGMTSAAIFLLLFSGLRLWESSSNRQDVILSTRVALERVSSELRYGTKVQPGVKTVEFETPGGLPGYPTVTKVKYELNGVGDLLRYQDTGSGWQPSGGAVLATGIDEFKVSLEPRPYDSFSTDRLPMDTAIWKETDSHGSNTNVQTLSGWLKVEGSGVGPQGVQTPKTHLRKDLVIETTFRPEVNWTPYLVCGYMNWSTAFEVVPFPPLLSMTAANTKSPNKGYALMANYVTNLNLPYFTLQRLVDGSEYYWSTWIPWEGSRTYRARLVLGEIGAKAYVDRGAGFELVGSCDSGTADNLPVVLAVPYDGAQASWDDFRIYRSTDSIPIRVQVVSRKADPEIALETSVLPR